MTRKGSQGDEWRAAWFRATVRRLGLALSRVSDSRRLLALRPRRRGKVGPKAGKPTAGG